MAWKDYREESKVRWGTDVADGQAINRDQIMLGAVLRIADASEKTAQNHDKLLRDLKWERDRAESLGRRLDRAEHSNAGLRGYVGRLKRSSFGGAKRKVSGK